MLVPVERIPLPHLRSAPPPARPLLAPHHHRPEGRHRRRGLHARLYLGQAAETDRALRLGRATEWTDPDAGPVRGRGQRLFLAGEEALAAAALTELVFD